MKTRKLRVMFIGLLSVILSVGVAFADKDIEAILSGDAAPAGVVFEIVDWDEDYLATAIPWVSEQIERLRQRFPELQIAVVSHGREQFALLRDSSLAFPQIHNGAQRLISDHDVELELCLGHANMRGFNASDFADYVSIEDSGPSRIAAYEALGYDKIILTIE